MNVLLVDDHSLFRAGLRLLLSAMDRDIQSLEAATLTEAIALARTHPDIRLCLLDLNMGNEYGLRALEEIRKLVPEIVVVVISGSDDPATVRTCIDAGAMSYIPKSVDPATLTHALQKVLAGEIYLPDGLLESPVDEIARPVLTPRQRDVLRGLSRGLPTKSIAKELALSEHTVKEHITGLFETLGVRNRTEAVIKSSRMWKPRHEGER